MKLIDYIRDLRDNGPRVPAPEEAEMLSELYGRVAKANRDYTALANIFVEQGLTLETMHEFTFEPEVRRELLAVLSRGVN